MALTPRDQRDVAWHSLQGLKKYNNGFGGTLTEAIKENGLDFEVHTYPLQANVKGKFVRPEGYHVIVRPETETVSQAIYGICGSQWKPVQNLMIAELLEPIMSQFTIDAIGSVNDGADLIIALKSADFEINGEQLTENLILRDSKKPGVSLQFKLFNTRLFCTNQLPSIGKAASFTSPIVHGNGASDQLKFQADILPLLAKARTKARASFVQMGQKKLTSEEIEKALAYIYPNQKLPGRARTLHTLVSAEVDLESLNQERVGELDNIFRNYQSAQERVLEQRKEAQLLMEEFNDLHSGLANTSWALFNAVSERADHSQGRADEMVAWSSLFGLRAAEKDRAFNAALGLVDASALADAIEYTPTARPRRARTGRPARVLTPEEEVRAQAAAEKRAERLARRQVSGMTPQQEREAKQVARDAKVAARLAKAQADVDKLVARAEAIKAREASARALLEARMAVPTN